MAAHGVEGSTGRGALGKAEAVVPYFERAQAFVTKQKVTTGSSIPQQLAKNIFLTPGQTTGRKTIEAVLAEEIARPLPRARTAELYLNYAQLTPHLYGICAASWYYFDEPPWHMSLEQASDLTGLLTAPEYARRAADGGVDVGDSSAKLTKDEVSYAKSFVQQQYGKHGGVEAAPRHHRHHVPGKRPRRRPETGRWVLDDARCRPRPPPYRRG
ncbi:hypothetical protein SAT01_16690 [Sinomonas atrocyanea]|uniref:transglycosylase domain-containing protein n=1 Tax=Sinomonas atrocyanea TaxID=37927 RepID=UPI00082B51A0|nr:transglycosylase domain-containing protein [Sinomonas atrocyanea]GEB64221.1 hypothetical protein SAT01_16690 [Sinomonas atrocyanea]GGG57360.1 hypothetical protein GCM10007172_05290 [Sinomonas atrocyanea]